MTTVRTSPYGRARVIATGLLALLTVGACTRTSGPPTVAAGEATVVHVVDGDTAVLDIGGVEESARLLGIDTPEVAHPGQEAECFGAEASARTARLLPVGTVVRLERDLEARDRYDRLLVYVYRAGDGLFVNETLVRQGFADTLFIEPNTAHESGLAAARAEAVAAGRGLWGRCPR